MPAPICPTPSELRIKCVNTNEGSNGLTLDELGAVLTPSIGRNTNLVIITSMDDFPPAVGGVRTLEPNTNYFVIKAGLVTADRFQWSGGVVALTSLWSVGQPHLTYTGTGDMFTAINGGLDIFRMVLNCPNGNFFLSQSIPPTPLTGLRMGGVLVQACKTFATIDGGAATVVDSGFVQASNGFILQGTAPFTFSLRQFNMVDLQGGVGVDLKTSIWNVFEIRDLIVSTNSSASGLSGLAGSGNLPAGRVGTVETCEFGANVTPLVNITSDDVRWSFTDNVGVANTSQRVLNNIINNAVVTNLTLNTPVPAAGTWTLINAAQFTQGAANTSQVVYVGERPLQFALDLTATLLGVTATPLVQVDVYLNGSPVPGASTKIEVSTTTNLTGSIVWLGQLVQNDTLEIFLTNLNDSTDVTFTDGTLRLVVLD